MMRRILLILQCVVIWLTFLAPATESVFGQTLTPEQETFFENQVRPLLA